jgi:aminotransferase
VINKVEGGINLGQGICDLDTPQPLVEGAIESIQGGDRQTYTPYAGLPELREQIAGKLQSFNKIDCAPDQVLVALGSSGAFFAAGLCLLEPGDEVILFEPFYSYHRSSLLLMGAKPVCVPLLGPNFDLDLGALKKAITPRTRGLIINTPGNPSGKVFTIEEMQAIAELLDGSDVIVFTDEVYEYMCFEGRSHVSPGTIDGLRERSLTMGSFSKTFSVTGWRIGYLVGPSDTVDAIGQICDQVHVCAPRPMQRGVQRALAELPASFYSELQSSYEEKRERFCTALETAGFSFARPQGAYYVLADYRKVLGDLDPHAATLELIDRIGVNAVPGHVFYENPEGVRNLRFQFAVTGEVLEEACRRFEGMA